MTKGVRNKLSFNHFHLGPLDSPIVRSDNGSSGCSKRCIMYCAIMCRTSIYSQHSSQKSNVIEERSYHRVVFETPLSYILLRTNFHLLLLLLFVVDSEKGVLAPEGFCWFGLFICVSCFSSFSISLPIGNYDSSWLDGSRQDQWWIHGMQCCKLHSTHH